MRGDTIGLGEQGFRGHARTRPFSLRDLPARPGDRYPVSGDTIYDSRLLDELPGSDISSYVKTVARPSSLAGIRMVCPGHDDCFGGDRLHDLCDAYLARRG